MDNQILSLYAKGMTTREIVAAFKELYDADVSPTLVVLHAPEGQTDVVFTAIISKRVFNGKIDFWGIFRNDRITIIFIQINFFALRQGADS
ncbi:transposase [Mixta calida B021323]|nr:transposase [Mixta calida B021323]